MKITHMLVATDLSQETTACIAPIADLARSVGARITLLHVLETLEVIPRGAAFAPPLEFDSAKTADSARGQLEERRSGFGPGIELSVDVVTGGDIAEAITAYAGAHDVDLIAVATHGRTGFRHLVLGSVAEGVIRRSTVPVLVLPRPKS